MRLNKFLAEHMGVSRRQADDLIAAGRVTIDGAPVALGARLSGDEKIEVDSQTFHASESQKYTYLMFNKPVGYVCSRRSQGEAPTIYEALPEKYQFLKTVGRLDKNSSGLILLTNDGDFAYQMTHPKFYKLKTYIIELSHALEPLHQQMISDFGINLPDGPSKLMLTRLNDERTRFEVQMSEGRNRQIRRTFAALGYEVTSLHRTEFGPYQLGTLKTGDFIEVKKQL